MFSKQNVRMKALYVHAFRGSRVCDEVHLLTLAHCTSCCLKGPITSSDVSADFWSRRNLGDSIFDEATLTRSPSPTPHICRHFPQLFPHSCGRGWVVAAISFSVLAAPSLATEPNKMRHPANPEGGVSVGTPTVSPSNTNEGSTTFDVNGTFNDDTGPSAQPFVVEVEWGDGSNPDLATVSGSNNPFSYAFHGTHTYAQDGFYSVFVRVTNNFGQSGQSQETVVSVNMLHRPSTRQ